MRQEGIVSVKEDARLAAEGERHRLASEMKKCTEGTEAVAAAEKVVEAARMVLDLERDVTEKAAPVEIGGWQFFFFFFFYSHVNVLCTNRYGDGCRESA